MSHIRFASVLGCGVVGTETGTPNSEYRFTPICRTEEAFLVLLRNLRRIVSYAEKMGVIIAVKPVRNHIIYNVQTAR